MVSQAATSLRDALGQKMQELGEALKGVDEAKAAQRPAEGEWCCKEVLSHLCGEEGQGFAPFLRRFVDEDTPLIGIVTGIPYYTPRRQGMTAAELLGAVKGEYEQMATFLGGLGDEQLARKARVPTLKETPIGEYPTLAQFAGALINFHLADHINQIRNARAASGAEKATAEKKER